MWPKTVQVDPTQGGKRIPSSCHVSVDFSHRKSQGRFLFLETVTKLSLVETKVNDFTFELHFYASRLETPHTTFKERLSSVVRNGSRVVFRTGAASHKFGRLVLEVKYDVLLR